MFWLRNKKNNFPVGTLIWGPVYIGSYMSAHVLLNLSNKVIQASLCKFQGLFKNFPTVFKN